MSLWAVTGVLTVTGLVGRASVLPIQSLHGPANGQCALLEIDIVPLETERFAFT
jgi:hypothetical protein